MIHNFVRFSTKIPLFIGALICWGAGLLGIVHWSYNFQYDSDFPALSQIQKALFVVIIFYFGSGLLIALHLEEWTHVKRHRLLRIPATAALASLLLGTAIWARPLAPDCSEVRRRMKDSGVAYNAREGGLLGGIKIDEPSGDRLRPEASQLAWWGKFEKPFEYWGSPDLTSHWFNPEGQPVASIEVDTEKCKLAKAVIKQQGFQPGVWRVDVVCEKDGSLIDQRQFAVGHLPLIPPDVQVVSGPVSANRSQKIEVE
ncbi:MAG: hypothetical protein HY587_05140 [Candidatus Omnitrophica bacterium]|nr:hypothetical protein [Candidatus Omnitrophota bacterium]